MARPLSQRKPAAQRIVLVTGASGMIGAPLVQSLLQNGYRVVGLDRADGTVTDPNYTHIVADLADRNALEAIVRARAITHTIHLAALAHAKKGEPLSKKAYIQANLTNAIHVFQCCKGGNILFISTVDVYGFTKGFVDAGTKIQPITMYAKTKAAAERELRNIAPRYNIYRFSPVYTEQIKRDIQKRFYLRDPHWAYLIGKGSEYEVLSVENAVKAIMDWVQTEPDCGVKIIKDEKPMHTADVLRRERMSGKAKHIIRFPRWAALAGYWALRITGKHNYSYLLSKAVFPLRSK